MKGKMGLWLAGALALLGVMLALNTGGDAGTASQEERRIAEVLSAMAGAGRVEVALFYGSGAQSAFASATDAAPTGAVIVAEGAGDWNVRLNLIRAARTLLGLPESAVDVFEMEEGT